MAPVRFEIVAVKLHHRQPGFPTHLLPDHLRRLGVPFRIVEQHVYRIVKEKIAPGRTTCSVCSRLRRGILYGTAKEIGATEIALGHRCEDILETLMLNMFFGGTMTTMPPKLRSDDGSNVVIRPLADCKEADIKRYSNAMALPIIPANLCGSQPNLQRRAMKDLLKQWDKKYPQRLRSMLTAVTNVVPSNMRDRALFDFESFTDLSGKSSRGDTLFDGDSTVADFQRSVEID